MHKESENTHYVQLLKNIKLAINTAQQQAAMAVNSRLLFSYWQTGQLILKEQNAQGWGAKVIEQLAKDLTSEMPGMKGFSKRNLIYMQKFAAEWPATLFLQQGAAQMQDTNKQEDKIVQQGAAQFNNFEKHPIANIPWSHHMVLLDKLDTPTERLFYCVKIRENNWSRKILLNQLDRQLHLQQGAISNNFETTLPSQQANLAKDTFKDPYFFDFLKLGDEASELEVEKTLVQQISSFLLELGAGFAYMGRQFKIEVGGQEYRLDLLFYHTKLHCYVNIELKIDEFKPEYVGKSQFYLTAINELVKSNTDKPSIGILLCKEANHIVVEYALKDNKAPIGVAEYTLSKDLPKHMKGKLPSAADFENTMNLNKEHE
ncbi:PDDEXK nuclease domain-containing protein [Crocinitomix algicola]|uniref:PDDEXK nuclease domain-containing protein n=1 Tax=Crocinitomix algicola TaxID=1740263 RepID=UPI0008731BA5|nr:PDDEXK nuclease domain-containing protein [Crocinitomix algicola]